jgi:hypothetical protein
MQVAVGGLALAEGEVEDGIEEGGVELECVFPMAVAGCFCICLAWYLNELDVDPKLSYSRR